MRIVSFLPAGTEIVHALGAGDSLVGRSHECDYPDAVRSLPIVSKPALELDGLSQAEIDAAVSARLRTGESLYQVDERLLRDLRADLILTQDLCQVCAPSGNELTRAIRDLPTKPEVVWLTPRNLAEIESNIRDVGNAIGKSAEAERIIADNCRRIDAVVDAVVGAPKRRVVFLEWIEPFFCGGHWVGEMIELAGGHDPLARIGSDSVRIPWEEVIAANPELLIVSPCGYRLDQAVKLARGVKSVANATTYAVDANAYFARPGPRVAEGIELLAHLFHPNRFPWPHKEQPWQRIDA